MGRPSIYSEKLTDEICFAIATSKYGLHKICKDHPEFPAFRTIFEWLGDPTKKEFLNKYARAREAQAEYFGEELLEIADETANDTIVTEKGAVFPDNEWINRSKLRVDTRKWLMSKLFPKKYGDKLEVEQTGTMRFLVTPKKKVQPEKQDE